jgi:hypothetical protein
MTRKLAFVLTTTICPYNDHRFRRDDGDLVNICQGRQY